MVNRAADGYAYGHVGYITMTQREFSRRQLFRLGPRAWANGAREKDQTDTAPAPLRPPGAMVDDQLFIQTCEKCYACRDACPYQAIDIVSGAEHGQFENTPFLNIEQNPCRWCKTMDCIAACPSSALSFNDSYTEDVPADERYQYVDAVARATLNNDLCLNTQGTICDECMLFCPQHVRAISLQNRQPTIDATDCVGCGLCAYHCVAIPLAITVSPVSN